MDIVIFVVLCAVVLAGVALDVPWVWLLPGAFIASIAVGIWTVRE